MEGLESTCGRGCGCSPRSGDSERRRPRIVRCSAAWFLRPRPAGGRFQSAQEKVPPRVRGQGFRRRPFRGGGAGVQSDRASGDGSSACAVAPGPGMTAEKRARAASGVGALGFSSRVVRRVGALESSSMVLCAGTADEGPAVPGAPAALGAGLEGNHGVAGVQVIVRGLGFPHGEGASALLAGAAREQIPRGHELGRALRQGWVAVFLEPAQISLELARKAVPGLLLHERSPEAAPAPEFPREPAIRSLVCGDRDAESFERAGIFVPTPETMAKPGGVCQVLRARDSGIAQSGA